MFAVSIECRRVLFSASPWDGGKDGTDTQEEGTEGSVLINLRCWTDDGGWNCPQCPGMKNNNSHIEAEPVELPVS